MSELDRLKWHCRRGMKELDLVLERFLVHRYDQLCDTDRQAFETLLDHPDQDILSWLVGTASPEDQAIRRLMEQIRLGSSGRPPSKV